MFYVPVENNPAKPLLSLLCWLSGEEKVSWTALPPPPLRYFKTPWCWEGKAQIPSFKPGACGLQERNCFKIHPLYVQNVQQRRMTKFPLIKNRLKNRAAELF